MSLTALCPAPGRFLALNRPARMLSRYYSTETPVQTAVQTPTQEQPVQPEQPVELQSFEELRISAQETFRKRQLRSTLEQISFRRSEEQPTDLDQDKNAAALVASLKTLTTLMNSSKPPLSPKTSPSNCFLPPRHISATRRRAGIPKIHGTSSVSETVFTSSPLTRLQHTYAVQQRSWKKLQPGAV